MAVAAKLFDAVIADISAGATLDAALKANKITPGVFYRQCDADEECAKKYALARNIRHDRMAEDTLRIADDDEKATDSRRLMVDTRKWLLSKLRPSVYGDKLDIEHSGNINVTVNERDA